MSRQFPSREVCDQLGLLDDLSIDDDKTDEVFIPEEDSNDDKEVAVDKEILKCLKKEIITIQMMIEPQVMKMQILDRLIKKVTF